MLEEFFLSRKTPPELLGGVWGRRAVSDVTAV